LAGHGLCVPRIDGLGVGAVVNALVEIAERYPAGLGKCDALYL
jgi:hypothetical protein